MVFHLVVHPVWMRLHQARRTSNPVLPESMAVQPSDLFYSVATMAASSYHRRHKEHYPRVIAMVRLPRL
jgi:hypothetical protein